MVQKFLHGVEGLSHRRFVNEGTPYKFFIVLFQANGPKTHGMDGVYQAPAQEHHFRGSPADFHNHGIILLNLGNDRG